jgi:ureidoglycolate dehydrogenase (NAD+)/L-2-hydroxycarboxylate dehydrogenase (NAD+)
VLFDPTIFGHSIQSFTEQVSGFLQELDEVPASDVNVPVSYPGQRGEERFRQALKSGEISLHPSLIEQLRDFARRDYA